MVTAGAASDYPNRPVKIVVPFPAGGTADAIPRIVADWLSRKWSQPVVIENRTGAAGNIGAEQVYHSAPDGYTLLSSPPPPLVINHNLYPKLGFDPTKFEPDHRHGAGAECADGQSGQHQGIERAGVDRIPEGQFRQNHLRHARQRHDLASDLGAVSADGEGEAAAHSLSRLGAALQGLVAGDVDVMFDNLGVSLALVQAGKLKLLAVASPDRLPSLPNVPTMAETLPGFEAVAWYGIVAPPKTPKSIIDKINADVNEALRQPELQEQLKKLSAVMFRRPGRQDIRLHARGSRPVGRGDQVGQYRAAVAAATTIDPLCLTQISCIAAPPQDQQLRGLRAVPACRFHATFFANRVIR